MDAEFKILPVIKLEESENIGFFSTFYLQNTVTGDAVKFEANEDRKCVFKQDGFGNDVVIELL